MQQTKLFENEWGVDASPPDPTEIVQIILYLDKPQVTEFKRLAKLAIRHLYPDTYIERGNVSTMLLKLLQLHYGQQSNTEEQNPQRAIGAELDTESGKSRATPPGLATETRTTGLGASSDNRNTGGENFDTFSVESPGDESIAVA